MINESPSVKNASPEQVKAPSSGPLVLTSQHKKLVISATYGAIGVASLMIAAKLFAWMQTDALSLQASLIDSLLDMAASIINFFVVRQALKPPDAEHRFGHGKAEALGALAQSAFIAGSAIWVMVEAIQRLIAPFPLKSTGIGSIIMIMCSFLTIALVAYQRYVIRQTRSLSISAESLHYLSDLYTNLGVLISLNVSVWLGWTRLDAMIGAGIGGYILYTSWRLGRQSLDVLMDRELPEEARKQIMDIAFNHPKVWGVHELRTRSAGIQDFIQMHLDMDEKLPLLEAHAIAEEVEHAVRKAFSHAEIIIHQDPVPHRKDMPA